MIWFTWGTAFFSTAPGICQPLENAHAHIYFFEELLKGAQASFLKPVSMAQLGRSGVQSFVDNSKCRSRWNKQEVEIKCFHHSIKEAVPLSSAERNARLFVRLLSLPKVSDFSWQQLKEVMAHDIVAELKDPFSTYFTEAEVKRLKTFGHWSAGIKVDPYNPNLIHSVRPDSSADKEGVFVGDQLLRVNGRTVQSLTYAQVSTELIGPPEELLVLEVKRGDEIMRFRLVRTNMMDVRLWAQKVDNDILYIRPGRFADGLADTMWVQLAPHANAKGFILDLRHNPGGLVTEGVSFLNGFLEGGAVGSVHPRQGHPSKNYEATKTQVIPKGPIVILVDGATASVSEFVAMVLQKRRKALLVGQGTLGKGRVQRVIPLPDKGSLKISVAELAGPSGKRLSQSIDVDEFLAPAAGGTAISGLSPSKDSWVLHAISLLQKAD